MLEPMTESAMDLIEFDALPEQAAVEMLLTCCSSPEWARALAVRRPYPDVGALLAAADAALAGLPEDEIARALERHPRIGDRPGNPNSVREQAALATAGAEVRAALAAGNRDYEARFGHVYLVCATGRSATELLDL